MCIINIHASHGKRTRYHLVLHCLFSIYLLDPEVSKAALDDVEAFQLVLGTLEIKALML